MLIIPAIYLSVASAVIHYKGEKKAIDRFNARSSSSAKGLKKWAKIIHLVDLDADGGGSG